MNEDVRNEEQVSENSEQGENEERRSQGARVPFEAMVEVGSAAGPSFEAHALDVSADGMHLKTSFLPEIGQPLTCRFDTGPDSSVLASGEVVWRQDGGDGGEFGVRFTDLDEESAAALSKIATIAIPAEKPVDQSGTKVRLHIEGLGSPMRAKVKGADRKALTVGSELGFLQVGKELELEDAQTGKKRPARIDRVDVEIDPETKVPQLVVSLKYEDVEESIACKVDEPEGDLESIQEAGEQMKGAFARSVAKVTPALMEMVKKAKIAAVQYAEKKMKKEEDAAPKRMTAPPPAGALHANGRKVIRDEVAEAAPQGAMAKLSPLIKKAEMHKKKIAIGSAAFALVALFLIGTHKHEPAATPAVAQNGAAAIADPNAAAPTTPAAVGGPVAGDSTMANAASPLAQNQNVGAVAGGMPLAIPPGNISASSESFGGPAVDPGYADQDTSESGSSNRKINVVPFGNGPVGHGNVLKIKMDGAIEKIEGAPQATGFTVVIPNRRSLEAAAPLAARDGRIASIKITNDSPGAELSLQFKDGVPNYQVRARGDELEIVLAPIGGVQKRDSDTKDHPTPVANRSSRKHPKKH
jgi:hypothetical protein